MDLDPAGLATRDRYKILIGAIVPRPIAFVSTISPEGRHNLAPFSFASGVGSDPMTLLFCPSNKPDGTDKDSLRNALPAPEGVGQFVVNVVTEQYAARMAATSEPLAHGESEFELAGLTPAPSRVVRPPRLRESPVSFECETLEIVRLNAGVAGGGNVVIGRVVWIHAEDGLIDEAFRVDADRLRAIGRMAGTSYTTTRDRFDLPFGRAALEST